jgi:hypothetical protein
MRGVQKITIVGFTLGLFLAITSPAIAQVNDVLLEVSREHLGLAGQTRLGAWTPIRLSLENRSSQPMQVICRWLLHDADGDRVMAQRRVTLDALATQDAWVYGPLPIRARRNTQWVIQVLNQDATVELARGESSPTNIHPPRQRLIGVTGGNDMGLNAYTYQATTHEPLSLITGLSLTTLPDRWYGLSAIDTLVWSRSGGDPDDPLVSSNTQQALREWVRRGGHLVIVLPAFGQTWTGSPLADLLPVNADQMIRIQSRPPSWLGAVRGERAVDVDITTFKTQPGDGVEIIKTLSQDDPRPVIVAKRLGAGRITLLGIDLADNRIAQMGLPNGRYPIWNDVFMWQAPVFGKARIKADIDTVKMSRPSSRTLINLGSFIPGRVSMRGTAATALLIAILLFSLYWLAAGPISFFALKNKNASRHSWLVFTSIVLGFSAVSWAGAWLFAPSKASISHFTLLDAQADSPIVHAHSWLSVYMPSFANQKIQIDPDHPSARNTLASPGMVTAGQDTAFLDPQTYTLDAGSPNSADIPFRSTAKQLEIDFLGRIDKSQTGLTNPIILPQGKLEIKQALPAGKLSHGLPGTLTNVRILYCPGQNKTPLIWQLPKWEPKQILDLGQLTNGIPLVRRPKTGSYTNRNLTGEGFLGQVMNNKPGQKLIDATGTETLISSSDTIQYIQLLSFFDTLPPPDFRRTDYPAAISYQRSLGRQLDITPLLAGHRLIVIGHLQDSPIPVPLTVDNNEIPSAGWTVVRWVYDFK